MNQTSSSIVDHGAGILRDAASGPWLAFTSATSDDHFCRAWLALQCGMIQGVNAGLLLLRDEGGKAFVPAALWPDVRGDLSYLGPVAERALERERGTVLGPGDDEAATAAPGTVHVAYPLQTGAVMAGVVALDLRYRPEPELQAVLRQLLWGAGWVESMLHRREVAEAGSVLERVAAALELIQSVQEQRSLGEAAIALVNDLATRLKADRVSVGVERDGRLQLRAISRTAWFDRKSQLVEAIENAMEEAIDQEAGIAYPVRRDGKPRVIVAQRDLALRSGAAAVLTVPLVSGGRPVGAITLERDEGSSFDAATILMVEVACELVGPVLVSKLEQERLLSGRAVDTLREWRDRLIGPRWPGLKLGAVAVALLAVFLIFATGEFRVTARTVIEGQMQRAAVAPFDGFIASAAARAGDVVSQGQVLATLDDREIRLERARWASELEQAAGKYREALAKRDGAGSRLFSAQQNQAAAQLALAEEKLLRTQLVAPLDSMVVSGDLSQMIGAPVERGKVLFELAPLGAYRVILQVDDRDISFVDVGQPGMLALTGLSGDTIPFTVKSVTSVATAQDGRNFFRVEADIADVPDRLRPGMEGVGKVSIGERRLVWIWTRNFVSWLRISLWNWLP